MRSDKTLPTEDFRGATEWKFDALTDSMRPEMDRRYETGFVKDEEGRKWHSFSGHERNRLFVNSEGRSFRDDSILSGLDNIADGRAFAVCDFDRDGWQDIALVNANYPLLNLYRNEIRKTNDSRTAREFIAVRLVGGNRESRASSKFSNRDAIGAEVCVNLGQREIRRELRCGEGFAAQNSNTLIIGIGATSQVEGLTVDWPSGSTTSTGPVSAGQLVTCFEDESEANGGFRIENYVLAVGDFSAQKPPQDSPLKLSLSSAPYSDRYRLITTMATWCEACKKQQPQLAHLRNVFPEDQLEMIGVPADPIDSQDDLTNYMQTYRPAYRLVMIDNAELKSLQKTLRTEALPSTIITDSSGVVIQAFAGVPSASAVAKLVTPITNP